MVIFTYSPKFNQHFSSPPRTRERSQPHSRLLQFTETPEPTESHQQTPFSIRQLVTRLFFSQIQAGKEAEPWSGSPRGSTPGHRRSAGGEERQSRPSPAGAGRASGTRTPPTLPLRRARTPFATLRLPQGSSRGLPGPYGWGQRDAGLPPPHLPARGAAPPIPAMDPDGEGAPFCGVARSGSPSGAAPRATEGERGNRKGGGAGTRLGEGVQGGKRGADTHGYSGRKRRCKAAVGAQLRRAASWLGSAEGPGKSPPRARAEERERCLRDGRADVSHPTGSAGGGGCAAPSRLRLHLRRAGGSSSSRASRALLNRHPPPFPLTAPG